MTLRIGLAIASIAQGLRAVLGAPDYLRYVQHLRDNHPEAEVLTRKDFSGIGWKTVTASPARDAANGD